MKTFALLEDGETGIHCPRCGMDAADDGECDHLYLFTTGQMSEPEYDRDDVIEAYQQQDEFSLLEFLDSRLGDGYLCFHIYIPAPSDFEAFYVYDLSA